jgi:hypothetical protein
VKKIGLALRSTVYGPSLLPAIVPAIEESLVDSVWFPSVGRAYDALDMCGISLGESQRLRVGTGVIRSADYEADRLIARVRTLAEGSRERFILGIGTGPGTGGSAIRSLVNFAAGFRAAYDGELRPPIFFAALKRAALRAAYQSAEGAILNFCPPDYIRKITPKEPRRDGFTLACYVKLFFAESDVVAKKMFAGEMKMYSGLPQYRAMFDEIGVSDIIAALDPRSTIPDELLEISLVNPSDDEIAGMLERFSRVGVDLPVVYPYVSEDDRLKVTVIERLCALA